MKGGLVRFRKASGQINRRGNLVLERLGMHPDDVELIRRAHTGAWVKVRTPFGETAEVQVTRGTPQGDALSPSLFVFFINLCLRHLAGAGVGFVHKNGVRRNNCTFADDICLIAESVKDMNLLLERVHEFCEWSGMALCLCKCEATGFDFRTETEENTDRLVLNGATMTRLDPRNAFKYLGVRLSLTGSTQEEVEYVKERTAAICKLLDGHPYRPEQMNAVIQMCAHPVLTYSGPLTNWTFKDLLQKESAKVYAKSWWRTGDKRQHQGKVLQYWRPHGAPPFKLEEVAGTAPIPMLQD